MPVCVFLRKGFENHPGMCQSSPFVSILLRLQVVDTARTLICLMRVLNALAHCHVLHPGNCVRPHR